MFVFSRKKALASLLMSGALVNKMTTNRGHLLERGCIVVQILFTFIAN